MQSDESQQSPGGQLGIEDLAERVGVPVRTVRFYIAEGLLPGPGARGKQAAYGEEHLLRLTLVRRLVDQHVPLKEIRERLAALSASEIRTVLADEVQREAVQRHHELDQSPREYLGGLLRRAQAARQAPPAQGASRESPEPAPGTSGSSRGEVPAAPTVARRLERFADDPPRRREASPAEPQGWRRWEVAPGVELHVRADAEGRYRELIERLLDLGRSFVPGRRW